MSFGSPSTERRVGAVPVSAAVSAAFLAQAFLWMFAGLLVTAAVAFLVESNANVLAFAYASMLPLLAVQLAIVVGISFLIGRISATLALGLFFVYAASLGVTIGVIVYAYTTTSVATAFVSAAAAFGGAGLYGATTKRSLAGMGGVLAMLLFGLIAASLLNLFLGSAGLSWALSLGAVVLFTILTAYDVQRIAAGDLVAMTGSVEKAAVMGALRLYLDFVNLFLALLRLFGERR
jgi:FtsH-binding integral membrane protein